MAKWLCKAWDNFSFTLTPQNLLILGPMKIPQIADISVYQKTPKSLKTTPNLRVRKKVFNFMLKLLLHSWPNSSIVQNFVDLTKTSAFELLLLAKVNTAGKTLWFFLAVFETKCSKILAVLDHISKNIKMIIVQNWILNLQNKSRPEHHHWKIPVEDEKAVWEKNIAHIFLAAICSYGRQKCHISSI